MFYFGSLGTPCGGCAWFSRAGPGLVADGRDTTAIPSVWSEYLVAGWLPHIGGAVALLGRSGDTMVCGRA